MTRVLPRGIWLLPLMALGLAYLPQDFNTVSVSSAEAKAVYGGWCWKLTDDTSQHNVCSAACGGVVSNNKHFASTTKGGMKIKYDWCKDRKYGPDGKPLASCLYKKELRAKKEHETCSTQ